MISTLQGGRLSRRLLNLVVLLSLLALALSACQSGQGGIPREVKAAKDQIKLEPGKAGVVGKVMTTNGGNVRPLKETVVRLARVFWNEEKTDGAFVLEGARSPSTISTADGVFVFNNVDPADYVIIVGEVIGDHVIISEPDGKARIYTATAGQTLEVPTLEINLAGP